MTMEDLSLHILDVAENAFAAGARSLTIDVTDSTSEDTLSLEISDDGKGMEPEEARRAGDPFWTTRTTRRVGLGLPLLKEAAASAGGTMTVHSVPGQGTTIRASFRLSHADRKPLGDMAATITTLLVARDGIHVRYTHTRDGRSYAFDTAEILSSSGGAALDTVAALGVIREYLRREEHALAR